MSITSVYGKSPRLRATDHWSGVTQSDWRTPLSDSILSFTSRRYLRLSSYIEFERLPVVFERIVLIPIGVQFHPVPVGS